MEISHTEAESFQVYLNEKVDEGIPGISVLIQNKDGIWSGAAGVADIIGHNGGLNGRRARMWYLPDSETTIIYLFNGGRFKELSRRMFRNEVLQLVFESE